MPSDLLQFVGAAEPQIETLISEAELKPQFIQALFKDAKWIFYSDGKFILIPVRKTVLGIRIDFIGFGNYKKTSDQLEFQGEVLSSDSRISVDGTIDISENKNLADYTVSIYRKTQQQITKLSQLLLLCSEISEMDLENKLIPDNSQLENNYQADLDLPNTRITILEGIPVNEIFDISIKGQTEAQPFDSLPAFIHINQTSGSENPISVNLVVILGLTNGQFHWKTMDNQDTDIQVKNGQISMKLKPNQSSESIQWITLSKGIPSSGSTAQAVAESAEMTLFIQDEGNIISGKISASGFCNAMFDDYFNKPSTYEAEIKGERRRNVIAEELRKTLSTSSFTGNWDTAESGFGKIELKQNGQKVSGTYTGYGGGEINGTVRGNFLDFTWEDKQRGKGWGGFRAIAGGGKLIGNWGQKTDKIDGQILIASWQLPPDFDNHIFYSEDLLQLEEDLLQLGYLCADLTNKGRCEQAIEVGEKALALYREKRQKEGIQVEALQGENELNEQFMLLFYTIKCSFQIGDYDKLLDGLDYALEIKRLLSPSEASKRLFRFYLQDFPKSLTDYYSYWAKTYHTQIANLQRGISFTGIGFQTEQNQETKEIVIVSCNEDAPAIKAGILPQDVILKVDNQSIQGLDVNQLAQRLRGTEGTQIKLTVRRKNQQLNFTLTRERIELRSKYRKLSEVTEYVTFLSNYLKSLEAILDVEIDTFNTLEEKIAQGQNPVAAMESLVKPFGNLRATLLKETDEIIARSKEFFKEQEELFQDWQTRLDLCGYKMVYEERQHNNQKELGILTKKINNTLAKTRDLTDVEKSLFERQNDIVNLLLLFSNELDNRRWLITRTDLKQRFEEKLKESRKQSARLANNLENWRKRLVDDRDKIEALDKGQPFFQKLVKILIGLGDEEEALVASEKSRARAFADLLAKQKASNSAVQFNADSPTLEQIKQIACAQKATIVEYFIHHDSDQESELFAWVINPVGKINFCSVDLKPLRQQQTSLSNLIEQAHKYLLSPKDGKEEVLRDATPSTRVKVPLISNISDEALKQLHQYLIELVIDFLPTDKDAPVIFIPQGYLFLLPFPALKDSKTDEFLVKRHTILTAPSIQMLEFTHQQRSREETETPLNALIVGNPKMPSSKHSQLPGSELAATAIATMLKTTAITGDHADKKEIMELLPNAQLIHFGSHAKFDDKQPLESHIVLASKNGDNGLLTTGEILKETQKRYRSPQRWLQAKLVAIDGCSTGRGKITGDGVNGLARSLMAAGVPCVVVSLWEVRDWPTAFLMIKFYQEYLQAEGNDVAKALKAAQEWLRNATNQELLQWMQKEKLPLEREQRQILRNWFNQEEKNGNTKPFQHPYFWAAFCVIGQ